MSELGATTTAGINRLSGQLNDRRPVLAAFAALNAVLAWLGGAALMAGVIDLGEQVNQRLPLDSPILGGIALMVIVALPLTILARMAWTGHPAAGRAAIISGGLLLGWIVVQLLIIREFSWFHPTYLAVGAALVVIGRRLPPRTHQAEAKVPDPNRSAASA